MFPRFHFWIAGRAIPVTATILSAYERDQAKNKISDRAYFSSQERPSVMICTLLPPFSGLTKIVSSASPRFRLSIEEGAVIRSLPSLVQPWVLRFADNSAQTLFTFALFLKLSCSTSWLYSTSDASFVRAKSLTLSL